MPDPRNPAPESIASNVTALHPRTAHTSRVDTLWYTRSPVPTPLGLAAQLGWFIEEFRPDGIDVFTVQDADDPRVHASHRDHHLAHSFRQGGNVHALWARARGRRTRVIGLHWLDEYQAILALPDAGIERPADLRGKRIALPHDPTAAINSARAAALRGAHVALALDDIARIDVQFVDVASARPAQPERIAVPSPFGEYADVAAALLRGDVDAIYVKGAHGVQTAAQLGAQVVFDIRAHPDPNVRANHGAPRPITVDEALIQARPDLVERFLACIVDVGTWAATHPHETQAYVAREADTSEACVHAAYGDNLHLQQGTDFSDRSIAALDRYKRFLVQQALLPADFDLHDWLDPAPLDAVLRQRNTRRSTRV